MNEGILTSIFEDIDNLNSIPQDEFKTCLESIESDLAELDSIDQSIEEAEKACFESIIEDINLFNSVIAYRNIKSGVALESVSSEFGIANEGIKELAEKGIDGLKAIGTKLMQVLKTIWSFLKFESKTVREIRKKIKLSEKDLKYIHKHTNNRDIFKKLYNPDRFMYIFKKELALTKFVYKDFDYGKFIDRLVGTYITEDLKVSIKEQLKVVTKNGEDGSMDELLHLEGGFDFKPADKSNALKEFFKRYEKITYTKSNNPFDYDGFDFLNNIYVLSDLIESNNKKLMARVDSIIKQAKVYDNLAATREKYGSRFLGELVTLLSIFKDEHKVNINEYARYCGEYLKEVKNYEDLDKETGSRTVAGKEAGSHFQKAHFKTSKPKSFDFKTFDYDD